MTVQHDTAPAPTTAPVVALPTQRRADHDTGTPGAAPQLRGWGTAEDRATMHWVLVGMAVLGLYAALMVFLGTRVFG